jgi:hypothetical protein
MKEFSPHVDTDTSIIAEYELEFMNFDSFLTQSSLQHLERDDSLEGVIASQAAMQSDHTNIFRGEV